MKKTISLQVEEQTLEKLREAAENKGLSLSAMIRLSAIQFAEDKK